MYVKTNVGLSIISIFIIINQIFIFIFFFKKNRAKVEWERNGRKKNRNDQLMSQDKTREEKRKERREEKVR